MKTFSKLLAVMVLGMGVGCGEKPAAGPPIAPALPPTPAVIEAPKITYNEALQTYETELKLMDRINSEMLAVDARIVEIANSIEIVKRTNASTKSLIEKNLDIGIGTQKQLDDISKSEEEFMSVADAKTKEALSQKPGIVRKMAEQQQRVNAAKKVVDDLQKSN